MCFAKIHDYDKFEAFDIGVVNDSSYQQFKVFDEALKTLGDGDDRLFNLKYVEKSEADDLLNDEKIEGYVYATDDDVKVKIKKNGTNQTVLATVVEQIEQNTTIIDDVAKAKILGQDNASIDVAATYKEAAYAVMAAEPNVSDDSQVMNMMVIEFYTLIAMACMQGAMLSVEMMNRCLPNISNHGKRVAVAPTRKSVVILSNLLAGYTMLFAAVMALIVFMRLILGVEFGANIGLVCLLAAVGSFAATMMGMLLSVVLKTNDSAKNVIVIIVTMVGCLFAGMFGGMKNFFDESLPLVNKVSPVGMITDGYYSLYYYDDLSRFWLNVISLLIVSAIFFVLSIRSLRRQRYDSI